MITLVAFWSVICVGKMKRFGSFDFKKRRAPDGQELFQPIIKPKREERTQRMGSNHLFTACQCSALCMIEKLLLNYQETNI